MYLDSFSASGFRSLTEVADIPVSCPTILAGRNDGGKSAVLTALSFLLGVHRLTDEDRTYLQGDGATGRRCEQTWVEGVFSLDEAERAPAELPGTIRIRRIARAGEPACWEYFGQQPADTRLRGLDRLLKQPLADLVAEFGLSPASSLKEDLLAAVAAYARTAPQIEQWQPLPKNLETRLPRLLMFGGKDERPDDAVRTALNSCYETHLEDEALQGQVRQIETEITQRLEKEADSLCQHIRRHCSEFVGVQVRPEVSFKSGFKRAPLEVSRADGEPVDLTRSGQGSTRRIALAVWEWTSNLLAEAELASAGEPDAEAPTQTIVVYDEPDTHLDYRHQRTVMDIIRKQCALPHVSVMVATHSMNLIDGVDIADVVHLGLNDHGRTVVERLEDDCHDGIDFHLGQIAAALGLRNSVLLHERCFLAVEGDRAAVHPPALPAFPETVPAVGRHRPVGLREQRGSPPPGPLPRPAQTLGHADDRRRQPHQQALQGRKTPQSGPRPGQTSRLRRRSPRLQRAGRTLHRRTLGRGRQPPMAPARPRTWNAEDFTAHRGTKKFSARVLDMIKREAAEASPNGKPAMLNGLVTTLTAPEDVPQQLREVFGQLQELAH